MRVILRYSLNGASGRPYAQVRNVLVPYGFTKAPVKTATWEHQNITRAKLATALVDLWVILAAGGAKFTVDHFWLYADSS